MSEMSDHRSVHVVEGTHPTVPGRVLVVCDTRAAAEVVALRLVNLIRSDAGLPPATEPSEFEEALRAAEIARQIKAGGEYSAHPDDAAPLVSIERQDLVDAEAALALQAADLGAAALSGSGLAPSSGVTIWSESEDGWWSNNEGWVSDEESATVFTIDEAAGVRLPISVAGDAVFVTAPPRPADRDGHGLENHPAP